jgi:elongation factor Ts
MQVSATLVKELRDKTGAGILDCKEALTTTEGNLEEAVDFLRKKGLADAQKRAGRTASEGLIGSYVHMTGKIGVLVEVNSETDFVARTDEFQELVKDIAMQVAASNPRYLNAEEMPPEEVDREKEIFRSQARESGKPDNVIEKITEGKFKKYLTEVCLLDQPFIKDTDITIRQLVQSVIAKLGENIEIRRFVRFQLGETV